MPLRNLLMTSSPRWLVFAIDLALTYFFFWFAYTVRFNFSIDFDVDRAFGQSVILTVVTALLFLIFKPYKGVVRLTGWNDLKRISYVSFSLMLILWGLTTLSRSGSLPDIFNYPYSIIFLTAFFQAVALSGARAMYKAFYYKIARMGRKPLNVLIYGTDDKAMATYELLKNDVTHKYIVKGFLSEKIAGKRLIQGIALMPFEKADEAFIEKEEIDELIITENFPDPIKLLEKTEIFVRKGVKVKTLPPPEKWMDNIFNVEDIKAFDLEALLERPQIKLDDKQLKASIKGKVIWVTGAAGSIGSELVRQILYYKPEKVYLIDQAETPLYELEVELKARGYRSFEPVLMDIQDYCRVEKWFEQHRPEIIFHAAAYKHVPVLEQNPYYGFAVNILATKKLMESALEYNVEKFIQISTDKAVNPTSVMGATKRVAELLARCMQEKSRKTQFIVTRFGNVLGSNGSVVHLFKKQIKRGGPITVTHPEINRYFMTIPEACHLVLKASEMGKGGEIYVFDMGKPVKIFDLAVKMIRLSGKRYPEDIDIKITGLRPGEKIYEELLTSSELVEKSDHDKLYISKLSPLNCSNLFESIVDLEKAVKEMNIPAALDVIKEIVPEYTPAQVD
jgi:FlaA1/EpsC-like NDP-sugar epimerase